MSGETVRKLIARACLSDAGGPVTGCEPAEEREPCPFMLVEPVAGGAWTSIASATAQTYTLASADDSASVRVEVTATNPDATVSAASTAVGPVISVQVAAAVVAPTSSAIAVVRNSQGTALATAQMLGSIDMTADIARQDGARRHAKHPSRTLVLGRAAGVRTSLQAWACSTNRTGASEVCSKKVSFTRTAKLRLTQSALQVGELRVVVIAKPH